MVKFIFLSCLSRNVASIEYDSRLSFSYISQEQGRIVTSGLVILQFHFRLNKSTICYTDFIYIYISSLAISISFFIRVFLLDASSLTIQSLERRSLVSSYISYPLVFLPSFFASTTRCSRHRVLLLKILAAHPSYAFVPFWYVCIFP